MKLLVLAQIPPPLHGQSLMVRTLLAHLPKRGIEVRHVPLQLSRDVADIGRWRIGKVFSVFRTARKVRAIARAEKFDALYYVPAPAKRGAFYRDIALMLFCRACCPKLILHWHSPGLGAWLTNSASGLEKKLSSRFLNHADLSLVLASELAADSATFQARNTAVVANGLPDPGAPGVRRSRKNRRGEILFLGLGNEGKGLFTAVAALKILLQRRPDSFRLTFAGTFESEKDRHRFEHEIAALGPNALRQVGFADEPKKRELFSASDLFCFPTSYAHEGQPLVLIEALAHDLPIVATHWRAIPSSLPKTHTRLVQPKSAEATAEALAELYAMPPPRGELRRHFLEHFTVERHLDALVGALQLLKVSDEMTDRAPDFAEVSAPKLRLERAGNESKR